MKKLNYIISGLSCILYAILFLTTSCSEGDFTKEYYDWDTTLYEVGEMNVAYSDTNIAAGETITFTDLSTRVYERVWYFKGAEPSVSTDSVVTVTFPYGGSYSVSLDVKYIDNQTDKFVLDFEVDGDTAVVHDGYGIYSENEGFDNVEAPILEVNNAYEISVVDQAYEGEKALLFKFTGVDSWGAMASILPASGSSDFSAYANGYYNIVIRTTCQKKMLLRLQSGGAKGIVTLDPEVQSYGLTRDGNWCELKIPMSDFTDFDPNLDLSAISAYLVLRSGEDNVSANEDWDFYIDDIWLSME